MDKGFHAFPKTRVMELLEFEIQLQFSTVTITPRRLRRRYNKQIINAGIRSVMVTVVGNGYGDVSSKSELDCLNFT